MPRERMLQAREHIKAKRYDEARAILKTIDHPTARKWLAKLNEIAPPPEPKSFLSKPVIYGLDCGCLLFFCPVILVLLVILFKVVTAIM